MAMSDTHLAAFIAALSDRYEDLKPLTGGGMAELLVGTERRLQRQVVIKRVDRRLTSDDARDRFHREIAVLATLQHPNIVPLLQADDHEGAPYFVMPLVQGESLRDRLLRGPLSLREAVSVLEDVAQALEAAHAAGVVHRDIKPGNILLTRSAAVVADFGIAKVLSRTPEGKALNARTPTDPTIEGLSLGTPRYMAPEQFVGDSTADHRVDLYAFGAVAYELLAGRPPFTATSTSALARAHMTETPPPLRAVRRDVPARLEALILKCLEKDPAARPRTASEMMLTLRSPTLLTTDVSTQNADRAPSTGGQKSRISVAFAELRQATRALARTPTLFAACLFCLALGIGSTAAVFSVVDRALLKALPFEDPDRLVSIFRSSGGLAGRNPQSVPNVIDLREDPTLDKLEAAGTISKLVELGDRAEPAMAMRTTGTTFTTLRVLPALGRLLTAEDDAIGAPNVVVLSHEFWVNRMGGSPAVVGTSLRLDGELHEIVGVLPPGFRIPHGTQTMERELWVPARFTDQEKTQRSSNFLRTFARLAPGRSIAEAQASIDARYAAIVEQFPDLRGTVIVLQPMAAESQVGVRTQLSLMLAAAIAVLAIAVINVSSLLLARGIRRQSELAVRSALGATRWQVMRPLFAECAVIAIGGTITGLGLAAFAVKLIGSLAAPFIPQIQGAAIDARTIAAAIVLAVVASTLGALAPALRAANAEPATALRGGRGAGRRGQHRTLAALVVAEGALALALLISAGLVLKGFMRLANHDPGMDVESALTMHVRVSPSDYQNQPPGIAFLEPALDATRAVPGVVAAGAVSQLMYAEWGWNSFIRYDGMENVPMYERPLVEMRNVSVGFYEATGQRLISGRLFDARDDASATPRRVVVNQALVDRDFPNRDPLGQRLYLGDEASEIIGVVSDIRNFGPFTPTRPEAAWVFAQRHPTAVGFWLIIRTDSDNPAAVAGAVETAIRGINPRAAVSRVNPMRTVMAESLGRPRFLFALFGTLGMVALLLALAGLFGMLSYTVEQQRREYGVRSALGAPPARLMQDVVRGGAVLLGVSGVIGLVIAALVTRALESVIYGVNPRDLAVWFGAILAMAIAGVAATVGPARRAGSTEPMVAMRGE
jgi:putative ABC transport system permease protein